MYMDEPEDVEGTVLQASRVYLLMSKEYRISRNRRAEWFFSNLNAIVTIQPKYKLEEYSEELEVVSIIPKDPPPKWSIETSHMFRYLVCSDTVVEILSRKYRFVYCLDVSPSAGTVDVQTGMVTIDAMFGALMNHMEGLVKPFYVPGTYFIFEPKIYVTVIAHAPFLSSFLEEAILQGVLLDSSTVKPVLQTIYKKLTEVEHKVAKLSEIVNQVRLNGNSHASSGTSISKEDGKQEDSISPSSIAMSPDFGLVDLLRHALIALHLLPENSASGLIVVTDGVISVPDGGYLDMILSQLRYNTVSCSFIQLSSPFHPHACYGVLPYADLMRFIATATFGAFLTTVPKIEADSQAMNVYHKSFLTWSFQESVESVKNGRFTRPTNKPGEWTVRNKVFTTIRDMPVVKKLQYEASMNVSYLKILSCRLREGFALKDARIGKDGNMHIKLSLAWKFLIVIEYELITPWPPPATSPKVTCVVSLEAPYDFLHDVTCLAKKPFQSYYRQLLVNKFWASQKQLSESDKLLAHFNSFSSNSVYYNIPESLKNGLPLFYVSSNLSAPTFSSDFAFPSFTNFWKPVCLLDTDIWQKWMHTHRIAVILEHDHPIPKYIHQPNPSGRFHVIQCRQTMMALNTLLKDWSSFLLVENHSYIKLIFREKDKPPFSFCIIRVTTKPPVVILRLAFLVGTAGALRHAYISDLRERITSLMFPQRLNEPPKWRVPSGSSLSTNPGRVYKRTWSDMPCCVILYKPVEKILIRYEQLPRNFNRTLLPQASYNSWACTSRKVTNNQSTFGFRPTYSTPWGSYAKMGPEMFNTVARYLHQKRWIWCVQTTPNNFLGLDPLARILSTITKMRLQEGFRFAYSSSGIVNLMMELELKNEKLGALDPGLESIDNVEDYERTTSVLQYVMFPPVTSLVSNTVDEEEEEREDDSEILEESTDLYLVTECWIEPQFGQILSTPESSSFNGMEYDSVPKKIFAMDEECISALVTFHLLSLMSGEESYSTLIKKRSESIEKMVDPIENNVTYIPFKCELKRILPKCRQAEILFSMFHQDLSMSFPLILDSERSRLYDHANAILFNSWITNVSEMHDREVILEAEEHKTLYEVIGGRQRALGHGDKLFAENKFQESGIYPKWRCFIKGSSPAHFLLTILPSTYHDLKLLMLSEQSLAGGSENKAVFLIPADDPVENSFTQEQQAFPTSPLSAQKFDSGRLGKRCRVKSGGESGPLPKKPLNRKSSLDNLFRLRTNSVETGWKIKAGNDEEGSSELPTKTDSEPLEFSFSLGNKEILKDHVKYGSITLPVYIYDCSLPKLTEHIIFRSYSWEQDLYTDCRLSSTQEYPSPPGNFHKPPFKQSSPEPKSEEHELPPTNAETLENHCRALEVGFAKSYVHGLFESLQAGNYIHKYDVQEAVRLCKETKIEVKLSEFIQTICRHFKEIKLRKNEELGEVNRSENGIPSCDELKDIHAFIKRRFNQAILSAFHWIMDCAGIFYFRDQLKAGGLRNGNSSKNPSDTEDTVKADSALSDAGENIAIAGGGLPKSPVFEIDDEILGPDFFTIDESLEAVVEDPGPVPLFLYLACTYIHGEVSGSFLVQDIPTCLEEIAEALGDKFEEGDPDEQVELFLEFVILTVPVEVEEVDYRVANTIRSSSMCSLSPIPIGKKGDLGLILCSRDKDISFSGASDIGGKLYPALPSEQYRQVKSVVEDIKWLLKDEITSFRWESSPLTELALTLVAAHVEKSQGKPGCQITIVPLNFVNSPPQAGFEKFRERFRKSSIEGYELKEEGSLYYLVPIPKTKTVPRQIVSSFPPKWKLESQKFEEKALGDEILKLSIESHLKVNEGEMEEETDGKTLWKNAALEQGKGGIGNSESVEEPIPKTEVNHLTTSSQMSEISSIVESMNTNEDGYEGDGSESSDDSIHKIEAAIRNPNLPPFWILCKLSQDQVVIYFHCRYDENETALYEYLIGIRNRVTRLVRQLKRIVNQDILLQQLHDTRQCSNLIEPKTPSPEYNEHVLRYPPPILNKKVEDFDKEAGTELKQYPPGYFACDVVWETKVSLHSRLCTGPGKSLISRGIQTLQATLIAFEVTNRQNMFVYRDTSGNVFYLRLYRMEDKSLSLGPEEAEEIEGSLPALRKSSLVDKEAHSVSSALKSTTVERNSESVVLMRVHGITDAGDEIKESLVQSLRNKLDDAVLDILSVTLDRNPHCKLTPEDVAFIQKPNSAPDAVLKNTVNPYACQHLPAFALYLHQNLLQNFCLPKYTELKSEFHFRDYSESAIESEESGTMYLYNQAPGGGTGSRGIACVAVSIMGSGDKAVTKMDQWSRPNGDAFLAEFNESHFEDRVSTQEIGKNSTPHSMHVGLRMWKQGRINMDLLKGYLNSAIRNAIWDLTTEFYFLTAPLCSGSIDAHYQVSLSAPSTPIKIEMRGGLMERKLTADLEVSNFLSERRNSIVVDQTSVGEKGLERIDTRFRSMSVNARNVSGNQDGKASQGRASSPMAFPFPTLGKGKPQQLDPLAIGLNRFETGDVGHLHCHYEKLLRSWSEFGARHKVPSLRLVSIEFGSRHPVETMVRETEKLIQQIIPEYDPKEFWKLENECEEYMAGGLRVLSDTRIQNLKNREAELKVLKNNLRRLENYKETIEDLLPLFHEPEDFNPQSCGDECILISRNLIHWKFCVGTADPHFFMPESYKTQYVFPPLISCGWEHTAAGSFVSLEKLPRPTSTTGLAWLVNEPESNQSPILIPRQRFLLVQISNFKISFIFYNWSKETADRLMDSTKLLVSWLNARSSLLCSIYAQKSGLFHNQAITRSSDTKTIGIDSDVFSCGGAEVDGLLKFSNPPKELSSNRTPTSGLKKPKCLKNLFPFLECFRNVKHHATIFKVPAVVTDPFKAAEDQMTQIKSTDKAEPKSLILQNWLSRGPSASNVIGPEGIEAFKQAARTLHYCLTPIIFLPRWRSEIASTRDNTIGILKKSRSGSDSKPLPFQLKSDLGGLRSRHDSGNSQKSMDSTSTNARSRSKSIWGLWQTSASQLSQESQASIGNQSMSNLSGKKADEKWHTGLCDSFIQEYMQYLQTLGFIPIQSKNSAGGRKMVPLPKAEAFEIERMRHTSGTSLLSSGSSQSGNSMGVTFNNVSRRVREDSGGEDKVFYLQKSLPGGIILFEVGLNEPFFYAKIHTLEATRIQSRRSRKALAYQNILEFVSQCERMKVLMHLHSFTYDFHLRSIHSYILGRQLLFKQGYHITAFLDDFIKYYPKGPNCARNTVHVGMLTIQNVTTPAQLLFNYILEKLYNMKMIRMNNLDSNQLDPQYILVDISSKRIVYRDMDDERQCDEFDLTVLIAHDFPPLQNPYSVDPSTLRLKYYIILTSRRELYPKVNEEIGDGKLVVVNTPEPLGLQRELKLCCRLSDTRTIKSRRMSIEERIRVDAYSDPENFIGDTNLKTGFIGIKEESVHYMGYFSSHEQMMQEIVLEQVEWVEERLRALVSTASVDCRRDLLWQRLLLANSERQKINKKEDLISRETVGALTYWEFGELLELVYVKSLSEMDGRLACLLRQPISFYQRLLLLITQGSTHNFRYFASPDKATHHMAIFNSNLDSQGGHPKYTKHIVMLEINLDKQTSDLSVLFKDVGELTDSTKSPELQPQILNLIESVVNTVCYCWWLWSTVGPT